MPSLVAEIGDVIESHLRSIGMLKEDGPDERQRQLIEEHRNKYEASMKAVEDASASGFPPEATLCGKCQTKAVIVMDGCLTCRTAVTQNVPDEPNQRKDTSPASNSR